MKEILRDYQVSHSRKLIKALKYNGAALDSSDTGTGKTFCALAIAKHLELKPIVLTPKSVIASWYKIAEIFGIDNIFVSNYEQYKLGNTEYLSAEKKNNKMYFDWNVDDRHLVVYDECFSYDSIVRTDKGEFKIGDIVEKDLMMKVLSFNFDKKKYEYKKIKHKIKKNFIGNMIKILFEKGELVCTPDHKIWIKDRGYVKAKDIVVGEKLQMVRKKIFSKKQKDKILFNKLFCKMENVSARNLSYFQDKRICRKNKKKIQREEVSSTFKKNEEKQSYEKPKNRKKGDRHKNKKWYLGCLVRRKRRQWENNCTTKNFIRSTWFWVGIGVANFYKTSYKRLSNKLQSRYRKQRFENSNRSRWEESQNRKSKKIRQKKGNDVEYIRVESVAFLERRYFGEPKENPQRNNFVYDIEVEDNHNYIVNSILVSNCHTAKNFKSQNSKMLIKLKSTNAKILCLSATIADNPLQMYALGLILGLFYSYHNFFVWAFKHGVKKGYFGGYEFKPSKKNKQIILKNIHKEIFTDKGSRISIKDLGDKFPDNLIITDPITITENEKKIIQDNYSYIRKELRRINKLNKEDKSNVLTEIVRLRQEIETIKMSAFIELTNNYVEEGNSVAVFVNFDNSISILKNQFKTDCIISGKIKNDDRQKNIDDFQSDKQRIIISNIKAGGVGISLHDINGNYPRISLISPTWSAQDLVQVLGRIHREGAKSKAIQRLIFCADTVEEDIADRVKSKIDNIKLINEGDLL